MVGGADGNSQKTSFTPVIEVDEMFPRGLYLGSRDCCEQMVRSNVTLLSSCIRRSRFVAFVSE